MPGKPVVTVKLAAEIRHAYAGGQSQVKLAAKYGMGRSTVGRIVRGQTLPDVPGPIIRKGGRKKTSHCWRGHPRVRRTGVKNTDCMGCRVVWNRRSHEKRRAREAAT